MNSLTKKYKTEIGKCEHCNSIEKPFDAAHIIGRERPIIIKEILDRYTHGGVVTIDIHVFQEQFVSSHLPLYENILVLCRTCHYKYDNPTKSIEQLSQQSEPEEENNEPVKLGSISNSEITSFLCEVGPKLSSVEIRNLQSADYCKNIFDVNFEVLRPLKMDATIEEIRKSVKVRGYARWSTRQLFLHNAQSYCVTTQWYDNNRNPFLKWKDIILKQIETDS